MRVSAPSYPDRDRTAARTCATPRPHDAASRGAATRRATESGRCPARLRPAGRARLLSCQTQYKCGQSGVRNNHPLGKTGYDGRLLLASGSSLSWEQGAAGTGLSNGVQMLVDSATDGSTKTAAINAMARPAGASASNCRPEGMTPTCANQAMRRAGTTGAEVA